MDIPPAVARLQHLLLVSCAFTLFTDQFHVRKKLHFHSDRAVALAGLAMSARNVERKMPSAETALLRFRQGSEEIADGVEGFDVRHRIRAWRSANRRLIDQHYLAHEPIAFHAFPGTGRFSGGCSRRRSGRSGTHGN